MSAFADARGYDHFMGRWSRRLAREFVPFGRLGGESVLDVGCGTGSLAGALLEVKGIARVTGVDPSSAFVEFARDSHHDPRVRFETGDAQQLAFEDSSFDCAASMLVLNFVPDPVRAAAEMRRVTRPGGRAAACVWAYGGGMAMLSRFWDAAVSLDPAAASRHERNMQLCREGELAGLWHATGLERVREGTLVIETRFECFADFWAPFLAGVGPSGAYAASLEPDKARALERKLMADLWNDCPDETRAFPARAWAVVGTVPERR